MAQLKPMLEGFGSGDAQGRVGYGQKFDARPAGRDIPEGGRKKEGYPVSINRPHVGSHHIRVWSGHFVLYR